MVQDIEYSYIGGSDTKPTPRRNKRGLIIGGLIIIFICIFLIGGFLTSYVLFQKEEDDLVVQKEPDSTNNTEPADLEPKSEEQPVVTTPLVPISPQTPGQYAHRDGFRITPPDDWIEIDLPHTAGNVIIKAIFRRTEPDIHQSTGMVFFPNINIVTERIPESVTLHTYRQLSGSGLHLSLTDFELIDDALVTTTQGEQAYIVGGTYRQGALTLRFKQLYVTQDNTAYIITGTGLLDEWDNQNYNALFDEVLMSFVIPNRSLGTDRIS